MLSISAELGGKPLESLFEVSRCDGVAVRMPQFVEQTSKDFGNGTFHPKGVGWVELFAIEASYAKVCQTWRFPESGWRNTLKKYSVSSGPCARHCKAEFIKHVFPLYLGQRML